MNTQVEKIKKEVLEEWFGTGDLQWADSCPKDEIGKENVLNCIELAIRKTAREILNELRDKLLACGTTESVDGRAAFYADDFWDIVEELEKKWGVDE